MAKKYTYSRAITTSEGKEEFSAVEFDSFDEALKAVDKGISDRRLQLKPKETPPTPSSSPESGVDVELEGGEL